MCRLIIIHLDNLKIFLASLSQLTRAGIFKFARDFVICTLVDKLLQVGIGRWSLNVVGVGGTENCE